jgi:hypothetical protein
MVAKKQILDAVRHAFLCYLATDDGYAGTIESIEIETHNEGSADVRVAWTFEGAEPPAPDDAWYTVFLEDDEIIDVDGPEW